MQVNKYSQKENKYVICNVCVRIRISKTGEQNGRKQNQKKRKKGKGRKHIERANKVVVQFKESAVARFNSKQSWNGM